MELVEMKQSVSQAKYCDDRAKEELDNFFAQWFNKKPSKQKRVNEPMKTYFVKGE